MNLLPDDVRSRNLKVAVRLCQEAVDGIIDAEVARRAVMDAAQRAGLLEKNCMPLPDGGRSVYRAIRQDPPSIAA